MGGTLRLLLFSSLFAIILCANVLSEKFQMLPYTKSMMPEQDVYLVLDPKSNFVFRPLVNDSADEIYLNQRLYSADSDSLRDPFMAGQNPLGPFPKGSELGFSIRDWLKAKGEADYSCDGTKSTLKASFSSLVPNSLYSLWYFQAKLPPGFQSIELPLGNENGTQNLFWTDSFGNANYFLSWDGCVPTPTERVPVGIQVIYHSDNLQKGQYAGEVGKTSHLHLMGLVPRTSIPVFETTESTIADTFIVFTAGALLAIFVGMSWGRLSRKKARRHRR